MACCIDLTGKTFGYWKVLYRAKNNASGQAYWHCLCTACGKEKDVSGHHLRDGHSTNCGCVKMEKMRQASIKDETGKIYGDLKVIRQATEEEKPRHDRTGIYWNCTCLKCGRENVIVFGDYLRNGDTTSCGCNNSKNESNICKMLDKENIDYIQQYSCPLDRHLKYDFAILNKTKIIYLIEYDGIQHFQKGHFSEDAYNKTHTNDLFKNQYCFENNIPLIRIPYDKEYTIKDLQLATTHFLLTKENEKKYYNQQ